MSYPVARPRSLGALLFAVICLFCCSVDVVAQDYAATRQLFLSGNYQEAETAAAAQVERGIWNERWPRLLIECQMAQGKYAEALAAYDEAIKRYPTSLTLRLMGIDAIRQNNLIDRAAEERAQFLQLIQSSPSRYASRDNLIAAGRYFSERGEDARQILQLFYDRVREADPNHLEAYIATAELALQKGDFKVAADTLSAAERVDATDPRTAYMLAQAWGPSDSEQASAALERALKLNSNHVPSLLLKADQEIDRERYEAAEKTIEQILKINPKEQSAFALRAVIAHVRGDYEQEQKLRDKALESWSKNPAVDHLIGRKLSQKYRFKEGAEYQRRAIELDANYTPATFQLAQDLLRLGHDDVGWKLAREVAEEDQYNVVAHNLLTLYDRLKDFSVLEADDIFVRMDPREASIYGDDVVDLLNEARRVLCEKYDVQPAAPVVVEIFPEQKDFAIRTFGLPGGAGFLGVCFGRVITANSPASQGERPSNWRSVLWHEFCHVVTLEKTKNRMPRWLSEGISVYEERQRDASWGESMTPVYREMLLAEDLTPVSDLSAAFLNPPSPIHLQFAYFESSLAVEFLIERHGIEALNKILVDLGDGLPINDALARNVGSLDKLDSQFADYARKVAGEFGKQADWSKTELPEKPSTEELTEWVAEHPDNYWGRRSLATALARARRYEDAIVHLEKLVELNTITGEPGGPLEMLATAYGKAGQVEKERETLEKIVSLSSDALPTLGRLIEMSKAQEDWESVRRYSDQVLSINPLVPSGHTALVEAAEQLDRPADAVRSFAALLQMEPYDPAGLNFRMAQSLAKLGQRDRAKHHVLASLDEAPRYRDAHRLLLELVAEAKREAEQAAAEQAAAEKAAEKKREQAAADKQATEKAAADKAIGDKASADKARRANPKLANRGTPRPRRNRRSGSNPSQWRRPNESKIRVLVADRRDVVDCRYGLRPAAWLGAIRWDHHRPQWRARLGSQSRLSG